MTSIHDDGLLELYVNECSQSAQTLEELLLEVERTCLFDEASISEAFRLVHTIKGSSAMMHFSAIERTSHLLEDVLSHLRKLGSLPITEENSALIHGSLEYAQYILCQLERIGGGQGEMLSPALIERLESLKAGVEPAFQRPKVQPEPYLAPETPAGANYIQVRLKRCPLPHIRGSIMAKALTSLCTLVETVPPAIEEHPELGENILQKGLGLRFTPREGITVNEVLLKLAMQPYYDAYEEVSDQPDTAVTQKKDAQVQVSQTKINRLLNRVDELLSWEAALTASLDREAGLTVTSKLLLAQLHSTLLETQILSSQLGMVEIGVVFSQVRRLIRDMARECGKKVSVTLIDADTMLDRSTVEILSEALIHIGRNAVDHGIELPEIRKQAGKAETGIIIMEAFKRNEQVYVRVIDDGGGIDKAAILQKAMRLGMPIKNGEHASDKEIYDILLLPGFSTSKAITKYSGRGVGLDTAAKRVRNVGGSLSIDSQLGGGTTFLLQIPTTITVMQGLEAQLGEEELLIPVNAIKHVEDLHHLSQGDASGVDAFAGYEKICLPSPERNDGAGESMGKRIYFREEYGRFYIEANGIGRLREVLAKALPQYVLDALDGQCMFSGCAQSDHGSGMVCILDVQRLIDNTASMERGTV